MNQIKATVNEIQNFERISAVELKTKVNSLSLVALELDDKLKVGSEVLLLIKATNVALSKTKLDTISLSNQLECLIKGINKGVLLSSITLHVEDTLLESIITTKSLQKLDLQVGEKVYALIKASDLSLELVE